ncbi:hypothetical protein BBJ41_13645 [Burkholderia stabilis]|nr:hypothetical protein BBJ41_13645 [Burkholderia stabilis]
MWRNAGVQPPRSLAQSARPLVNGRNGMAWRSALRATIRPSFVLFATRDAATNARTRSVTAWTMRLANQQTKRTT